MVPQEIENRITTRSSNSTSGYVPPKLKAVSEISADLCSQQHWSQELNHESSPCVLQQMIRKDLLMQWNIIEPSKEGNSDMLWPGGRMGRVVYPGPMSTHSFTTNASGGFQRLPPPLNSPPLTEQRAKTHLTLLWHLPSELFEPRHPSHIAAPTSVPNKAKPTTYHNCWQYHKQKKQKWLFLPLSSNNLTQVLCTTRT